MLLRVRSCVKVSRAEQLRRVGTESEARMQEIVKKLPGTVGNSYSTQPFLFKVPYFGTNRDYIESAMGHESATSQLLALRLTCHDLSAK